VLNYLKILYGVFLDIESDKSTRKWILPSVRTLPKTENLLYCFLGLTNFSENFVYYVFYGSEFDPGVYSVILDVFTRYFRHNFNFRDFLIIFFVPPIISRKWHEKIFPNFYGSPMTDIYDFWKFHGNPGTVYEDAK